MPALQVRDLPQELYDKLVALAQSERRSLAQQTIVLLEKALLLEDARQQRQAALERLLARPMAIDLDPVALVREDRDE